MKGEGQNRIPVLNFLRYKDFCQKSTTNILIKLTTNIFHNKDIREMAANQKFLFLKDRKMPKKGHYCARVRAQVCTSKTRLVSPKDRFLSIGDTSRKQVFSLLETSDINAEPKGYFPMQHVDVADS